VSPWLPGPLPIAELRWLHRGAAQGCGRLRTSLPRWVRRGATSFRGREVTACPDGLAVAVREPVTILVFNLTPGMPSAAALLS